MGWVCGTSIPLCPPDAGSILVPAYTGELFAAVMVSYTAPLGPDPALPRDRARASGARLVPKALFWYQVLDSPVGRLLLQPLMPWRSEIREDGICG